METSRLGWQLLGLAGAGWRWQLHCLCLSVLLGLLGLLGLLVVCRSPTSLISDH